MEIKVVRSTGNYKTKKEFLNFSKTCGRQCYSEKDWEDLEKEPYDSEFIDDKLKKGHHSFFEHVDFVFYMKNIPKAFAMILNNEKQYVTSEKSARYTKMKEIVKEQGGKYDKWMNVLIPEIDRVYPKGNDMKKRKSSIKKLAQENARYMTSVFTPTKMIHKINLRQINFLIYEFENFIENNKQSADIFKKRLSESMEIFLEQTENFKVKDLKNQTDRHLSFFGDLVEDYFGSVYSTSHLMSFACLAQAQRHRTINYHVYNGVKQGDVIGFFVPEIIKKDKSLKKEWIKDLKEVAKTDFPQAQLINVCERGLLEDFRSKMILRLCGHAQYEIMRDTLEISRRYRDHHSEIKDWMKPKCLQGMGCNENCVWGGKKALERII